MNGYGWRRLGSHGTAIGMPPAVFLILLANLAVFLLRVLTVELGGVDPLGRWFSFSSYWAIHNLQIWRFVSYMFLHGGLGHLFFNMIGLWLFGSRMELYWGTRTFAWYYFVCGIGGAVLHGLFSLSGLGAVTPMIGASGAIFGILLSFGLAFPRAVIFVFFIIPMPAFIAVILFGLLALIGFGGPHVAHLAHIGGMVAGFFFLWFFTGGRFSQVPRLPGKARGAYRSHDESRGGGGYPYSSGGPGRSLVTRLYQKFVRWRTRLRLTVVNGQRHREDRNRPDNESSGNGKGTRKDINRVDEILEKISHQGLKSLTPEEQEILRRASKRD